MQSSAETPRGFIMLITIAVIILVLWGLGLVTHIAGGLVHIILDIALIVFVLHFVRGRA